MTGFAGAGLHADYPSFGYIENNSRTIPHAAVGIVTRANLMRALVSFALAAQPAATDDAAIRERLLAELKKQVWAPVGLIDIVVNDGVVKLGGALTDERERQAIRVAAENIAGVKKVEDHLIWIEPNSGFFVEAPEERPEPWKLLSCPRPAFRRLTANPIAFHDRLDGPSFLVSWQTSHDLRPDQGSDR
jgi:BON domain